MVNAMEYGQISKKMDENRVEMPEKSKPPNIGGFALVIVIYTQWQAT